MHNRSSRPSTFELAQLRGRAAMKRQYLTIEEAALWQHLRGSQLGVAFRRQVPLLDRFIVDFLAPSLRLIVEVDGLWHERRLSLDERRDRKLARMGYRILRLDAALVIARPLEAVQRLREVIAELRAARTQ